MKSTAISGGEAVVRALEAHDVEIVFGIPGTHSLPIYKHLVGSAIRHVLPRHEQGAGFAADGYARASGRPGVCIVTTGPGVTNVATAAAQAYSDSIPVLVISPGMPTDIYRRDVGYVHEAKDQSRAMHNLVSWSHRATSPEDVVASIYRAFAEFSAHRPRPAHVEIPLDVLDAVGVTSVPDPQRPSPPLASPTRIGDALAILETATRPGLILGGGAHGAAAEVGQLARRLGAIVLSTASGKGVFPEDDELTVGALLNYPAGREALGACDVVIAVGTELSDVDLEGPLVLPGQVIRVDIDAAQLDKNLTADCAIHADASEALRLLLAGLDQRSAVDGVARAHEARSRSSEQVAAKAVGMLAAVEAVRSCVGDAIVACDTSMFCYRGLIPARLMQTPRSFINPTGYATLGYGLPAGIGAKLAQPNRRVVVVTGDGGILFTLSELSMAVEQKLQLPIVITTNHGYGEIREGMIARDIEPLGVTFDPPSFSLVAEAFGARGVVVPDASELGAAIDRAFTVDGPTLIEIAV